jgi:hypothetical protein
MEVTNCDLHRIQGQVLTFRQHFPHDALNSHKKAPRTLRWWSFFKKPYVGIADQSRLLEGLKLRCGKLTTVVENCQENIARVCGQLPG